MERRETKGRNREEERERKGEQEEEQEEEEEESRSSSSSKCWRQDLGGRSIGRQVRMAKLVSSSTGMREVVEEPTASEAEAASSDVAVNLRRYVSVAACGQLQLL